MEKSASTCGNSTSSCPPHYHAEDPIFTSGNSSQTGLLEKRSTGSPKENAESSIPTKHEPGAAAAVSEKKPENALTDYDPRDQGFRRIVRNFTPSWFIITMGTGVVSILLHQLPYNGHWLEVISIIFFVLNVVFFITFTFISALRYFCYPRLIRSVLRHPHQSLFVAAFPIGIALLVNTIVLICVPSWGSGMAIFAWVLWWIAGVLSLATCFDLTFNIMRNQRSELAEMTALYLIPIVSIVAVASSGGLVAGAIPDPSHKLWTLIVSYVFWSIGTPLSWIILTVYFLRMTVHKPLKREVVVSLLLPIGPLSLSGFSIISLGKAAKTLFPILDILPNAGTTSPGDVFYIVGAMMGLVLWGFSIIWFVVALVMIALAGGFPFNMGWWGFIFPVGVFTLLTVLLGEEFNSKFFDVLSCVFAVMCVLMWLVIAAGTVQRSITGEMFFAPCLGTDLFLRRVKAHDERPGKGAPIASKDVREKEAENGERV